MAPIQSRVEKPPNSCLKNLIHSGVVFGGVSAFGPSRARISLACDDVRPWARSKPNVSNRALETINTIVYRVRIGLEPPVQFGDGDFVIIDLELLLERV